MSVSAAETLQWQRAYDAWKEERFADAHVILLDEKIDTRASQWLLNRLLIDMGSWQSCAPAINTLEKIQDGLYAGAIQQLCAEYFFLTKDFRRAVLAAERALLLGGRDVDEAGLLLSLAELYYRQGNRTDAQRFAYVLWQAEHYELAFRIKAGLLYADLIKDRQPQRAREILSEIRLSRSISADRQIQATLQLLPLLLPDQAQQAERIILTQLQRLSEIEKCEGERGLLRAWHVMVLFHFDQRRAKEMLTIYDNAQHPILLDFLKNKHFEQQLQLERALQEARQLLKDGEKSAALRILKPLTFMDKRAQCLAIDAGMNLEACLSFTVDAEVLLRLYVRERDQGMEMVVAHLIEKKQFLLDTLGQMQEPTSELVSVLLIMLRSGACDEQDVKVIHTAFDRLQCEHVPLALWYARQAQRIEPGQAERYWLRVLELLPSGHDLAGTAAERVALFVLRPVPPGTVIRNMSDDNRLRFGRLINRLTPLAWDSNQESALRCRYLLAQALTQTGRLGEARLCFESLQKFADESRKVRIDKALDLISEADPQL